MRRWLLSFALVAQIASVSAAPLKIATIAPEGSQYLRELRAAGEAIKTQTQGRVEFKFFPGGVMGSDASTVLRKIKLGQLQGGAFSGTELSSVSNDGAIYGLPFFFASKAEFDFVLAKSKPLIQQSYAAGGMWVPGICSGGYAYMASVKPIATIEALKATKVWSPAGDPIAEVGFRMIGASTVPLSIPDVYPSLQTGLVETIGGPLSVMIAFQWHTKVKYMADVPLTVTMGYLAFDKKAIDKLSAPDQAIVNAEVDKAFAKLNTLNFDDAAARAALIKQGITISPPTAEQNAQWAQIGDKSLAELKTKNAFSKAVLDTVIAARAEFRAKK
jgi:TRAP-type transport system periplasmic protein